MKDSIFASTLMFIKVEVFVDCNRIYGESDYLWGGKEFEEFIDIPWYDSGARFLTTEGVFASTDPLCEKGYNISPYTYCAGDPVNRVDPEGMFPDLIWDLANVGMDVASLAGNIKNGKWGAAALDGLGLAIDVVAAVIPVIPGGAGAAIKAVRAGDKATDAMRAANTAVDTAKATDKAADVGKSARAAETSNSVKSYQTYTKTHPDGTVYVGRTSGTGTPEANVRKRDSNHHMNKKGFESAELDKSSFNPDAIRGQEQYMIEQHGGAKSSGGTSGNAINRVSPNNPRKDLYNKARIEYIK